MQNHPFIPRASRFSLRFVLALVGFVMAGLAAPASWAQPKVVATTNYVSDVVKAVGGDRIDVHLLMGPSVDPHLFKPTARDVFTLRSADAIFYNGLLLEGKLDDLLGKLGSDPNRVVMALTDSIDRKKLLVPEGFQGHYDPHVWNDPTLWATTPGVVAEGLTRLDPENGEEYRRRAEEYSRRIRSINDWAKEKVAELAPEKRILITSHDAFNYLGQAFGFEVLAPQGISTLSQAGIADIVETVDFIKAKGVGAIFVESSVSPQVIERIAAESGAKVGGELFSDAMGGPAEIRRVAGNEFDTGTYEGVMKYNITTIVEALK